MENSMGDATSSASATSDVAAPTSPTSLAPTDQSPQAPAATEALPLAFAVDDHVRNVARGVDRRVHGVRRSPEGTFLQFSPEGPWLAIDGFERVADDAAEQG
jgi:hypothetical protein